ncbi:phage virion morphogenesis protein [Citreimonas sp.]|uniref:phage virion morphogenesis protein n=1 Tax=Citreimonas sp. TaxID=3036715 RepID=UPI0035C80BA6
MIRIEANTDPIIAALARAAAEMDDLTPLMQDIGEEMLARTDQNFLTGTAPDGTPWAPRSQATLDAYARRNPPVSGIGTLRLTDTMRKTIAYEARRSGSTSRASHPARRSPSCAGSPGRARSARSRRGWA